MAKRKPNRDQFARKTPWELFEGAILWGVLEGDDDHTMHCLKLSGPETLDVLLKDRLARLDFRFLEVMVEIGCDGLHDEALAWHRENG